MTDEVEQRLAKGSVEVVTGMATGSPLKMGQGLLTMLGLETNASAMQRYVAADYETFVTDTLQGLTEQSRRDGKRLDTLEQRQLKMAWVIEEFERKLDEQGARVSDLVVLLEAGFKVWKSTADAKKRQLLGNALRNAFDPKQYEEGLTLRLLSILGELTYGEMFVLRGLKERYDGCLRGASGELSFTSADLERNDELIPPLRTDHLRSDSLLADHLKRLVAHGLIFRTRPVSTIDGGPSIGVIHIERTTDLGERLLALTADPPRGSES